MKIGIEANRLRRLRDALLTGLVERDLPIRLALIASLAGEHLLMVGPPGTAKSLIARRLHQAFAKSSYFERLLTRFTVPEELFGPLSIKGLEEDRYERLTEKYLPTASIAFLDEIFKANSAILNSLLTLLNEREFDNGTRRDKTPLIAVIGASNELPKDEELDALFDRFLLRVHVGSVSTEGFSDLIGLRGHAAPDILESLKLTDAELLAIQVTAEEVDVPNDVVAILGSLREWCAAESIQVSDRRWRKIVKLLQVSALTNERETVSVWDCWLLQHCLWSKPEDREKIYEWYGSRIGASATMDPSRLTRIVVLWEGKLKKNQGDQSQMRDDTGKLVFRGFSGDRRDKKPPFLYLAPPNSFVNRHKSIHGDRTNGGKGFTLADLENMSVEDPYAVDFKVWKRRDEYLKDTSNYYVPPTDLNPVLEPTRHKKIYINDCLRQIDEVETQVALYQSQLTAHIQGMVTEISTHLWVTSNFITPAVDNLVRTQQDVKTLLARVRKAREGFELLPIEVDFTALEDDAEEEAASK